MLKVCVDTVIGHAHWMLQTQFHEMHKVLTRVPGHVFPRLPIMLRLLFLKLLFVVLFFSLEDIYSSSKITLNLELAICDLETGKGI